MQIFWFYKIIIFALLFLQTTNFMNSKQDFLHNSIHILGIAWVDYIKPAIILLLTTFAVPEFIMDIESYNFWMNEVKLTLSTLSVLAGTIYAFFKLYKVIFDKEKKD